MQNPKEVNKARERKTYMLEETQRYLGRTEERESVAKERRAGRCEEDSEEL